jgi:hypothetical protein
VMGKAAVRTGLRYVGSGSNWLPDEAPIQAGGQKGLREQESQLPLAAAANLQLILGLFVVLKDRMDVRPVSDRRDRRAEPIREQTGRCARA